MNTVKVNFALDPKSKECKALNNGDLNASKLFTKMRNVEPNQSLYDIIAEASEQCEQLYSERDMLMWVQDHKASVKEYCEECGKDIDLYYQGSILNQLDLPSCRSAVIADDLSEHVREILNDYIQDSFAQKHIDECPYTNMNEIIRARNYVMEHMAQEGSLRKLNQAINNAVNLRPDEQDHENSPEHQKELDRKERERQEEQRKQFEQVQEQNEREARMMGAIFTGAVMSKMLDDDEEEEEKLVQKREKVQKRTISRGRSLY